MCYPYVTMGNKINITFTYAECRHITHMYNSTENSNRKKKQLILRSLYYHPKAKLVFFKNHKNVRPEAYETMRCSFHPDQCNV